MAGSVQKAHLGRDFERMLEQAHEVYAVKKIADVKKNPTEWRYTNKTAYDKMRAYRADLVAITNTGRYIKRVKSNIDFSGVAGGRYVTFDAKQVSRQNFPLSNLYEHQLENLYFAEQCGAISGLMIHFTEYKRTFFVPAKYAQTVSDQMLLKGGKKSISLGDCEENGVEVPKTAMIECDWFSVLVEGQEVGGDSG
jgi:recombination protein U